MTRATPENTRGAGPYPKECRTARVLLIEQHYLDRRSELTWDRERFDRLCAALQVTPYELGAFLRMPPLTMKTCLKRGKFSGTVELHLTLLERTVFPASTPPIFPPL